MSKIILKKICPFFIGLLALKIEYRGKNIFSSYKPTYIDPSNMPLKCYINYMNTLT